MSVTLPPNLDEDGFYGIRLESIGGLGAHLAGQLLAEVGVLRLGLNGSHFSSYGSEKKGTPVKSFIRFCDPDRSVRTNSPVERPHLIAVFHEALIGREKVALGLRPRWHHHRQHHRQPGGDEGALGPARRHRRCAWTPTASPWPKGAASTWPCWAR